MDMNNVNIEEIVNRQQLQLHPATAVQFLKQPE